MLELLLMIAAVVAMARIASADGHSPWLWGIVTVAACLASAVIPLPFVRVLIAFVVVFVAMMVYKGVKDRPEAKRRKVTGRRSSL